MSSIGITPSPSPGAVGQTSPAGLVNKTSGTTDQTMFLQLLVSELQNQDPLNPVQGTDFVTQLAQFQQLEQTINSGQDMTAMHTDLDQIVADLNPGGVTDGSPV